MSEHVDLKSVSELADKLLTELVLKGNKEAIKISEKLKESEQ